MTEPTPMTEDEKASAVLSDYAGHPSDTPIDFDTSGGLVRITNVEAGAHPAEVIVYIGDNLYENEIHIINPPVYRPDPTGDVEVNGVMYKYDPLGTVAEVIGMQIGGS
jgi:hypothetical protein